VRPALFFLTSELQRLTDWIRQSTQSWGYGIDLSAITPTEVAIGIAVILLVVVAIVIDLSTRKRRTGKLHAQGSGIDARPVNEDLSLRQMETLPAERLEREERARRAVTLHILPLAPGDRVRFLESWGRVQSRFIDGPGTAVADADQLLGDVLSTRGYPVKGVEQRGVDISVDHPQILENYRAAHQGALRRAEGQSSTEDLRQVMIHYRTLFEELVGEPGVALS